ncbi:MAG: c-type cytochrome [Vicinamibacteria bacterium]
MTKTSTRTLALAILWLGAAPFALAAGPNGQDLYKTNCKACHAAGSPHGEYTPMTLIQEQWERFFDKKYVAKHEGAAFTDGRKVLDAITPEMLAKIRKFAIDHAADSEQPMTCGK